MSKQESRPLTWGTVKQAAIVSVAVAVGYVLISYLQSIGVPV